MRGKDATLRMPSATCLGYVVVECQDSDRVLWRQKLVQRTAAAALAVEECTAGPEHVQNVVEPGNTKITADWRPGGLSQRWE
jgi:hypothetical protein